MLCEKQRSLNCINVDACVWRLHLLRSLAHDLLMLIRTTLLLRRAVYIIKFCCAQAIAVLTSQTVMEGQQYLYCTISNRVLATRSNDPAAAKVPHSGVPVLQKMKHLAQLALFSSKHAVSTHIKPNLEPAASSL